MKVPEEAGYKKYRKEQVITVNGRAATIVDDLNKIAVVARWNDTQWRDVVRKSSIDGDPSNVNTDGEIPSDHVG